VGKEPALSAGGGALKSVEGVAGAGTERFIGEAETAEVGMAQGGNGDRGDDRNLLLDDVGGDENETQLIYSAPRVSACGNESRS